MCVVCITELFSLTFTPILTSRDNGFKEPLGGGRGRVGNLIKVSYRGLVWSQRRLTFHVETRHQNKLH